MSRKTHSPSQKSRSTSGKREASKPAVPKKGDALTKGPAANKPAGGWRAYRQEIQFLVLFLAILGGGFSLLSVNAVNDHVIEPFTAGIAKVSGVVLDLIGQDVTMSGTRIRNQRFAVNIRNGCNGVEAMIIFLAAVLAFPASWPARMIGLTIGILAIQIVNLIRVVALFLTGAYFPAFFDSSHTVVWQTIVILFGVMLWIFWANRFAMPPRAPQPAVQE